MTLVNYVTRIKLNSIVSLKTLIFADRYSSGRACPFTRIISFKLCARLQSTRRPSSQPTMTRHPRNTRTSKGHGRDSAFVERRRPESDLLRVVWDLRSYEQRNSGVRWISIIRVARVVGTADLVDLARLNTHSYAVVVIVIELIENQYDVFRARTVCILSSRCRQYYIYRSRLDQESDGRVCT